jgi:hypothetical protein
MRELYAETLLKESYLHALGYSVSSIWEWERSINADPTTKTFLTGLFLGLYPDSKKGKTLDDVVGDIRSGKFFGLVECDLRVPSYLEEKFAEMAPIFKNVDVSREHLSEHMENFAEGASFLKRPQRMLIGSLFGEKILLLSELVKWYLEQGLEVTRVYQLVEYVPRQVYKEFADSVSNARRAGDTNPDLALLASTSKLIGNSAYGKTITNKERHRNVKYVDGAAKASAKVCGSNFISLDEISSDFYEVELAKQKVRTGSARFVLLPLIACFYPFVTR